MARYYFFSRKFAKRRPEFNKIGWRIEAWAIAALIGVFRMLPLETAMRFAHWSVCHVRRAFRQARTRVRNLLVAFPDATEAERNGMVKDIFGHVGVALAEIAQLERIWNDRERRIEFVASPEIQFLKETGKPAVLVTAHIGPWTLTNFAAGQYGFPLSIVYAPESNPYVHDMMLRLRGALPVELLARDNSMRMLMGELSHGEIDRTRLRRAARFGRDDSDVRPRHADEYGARTAGAAVRVRARAGARASDCQVDAIGSRCIRRWCPTRASKARQRRRST